MHHVVTHIHGEVENNKLILSFPRHWGSFWKHFMWHNKGCQMAWACRQTVAINWLHAGWQKHYSNTYRRNNGGVCGQVLSVEGHFITPYLWSLAVDEVTEGIYRNGCYTMGYALSSSAENSQIRSHSLLRRLWVWNNIGVVKLRYQTIHKKFQHLDQYLM
jgi:hypothetical protein